MTAGDAPVPAEPYSRSIESNHEPGPTSAPGRRDLIVVGASAGGVEALCRMVAGLPPDLAATICVVLHLSPDSPSVLPRILSRAGELPCRAAADGDPLETGQILVARPDRHLVIEDRHVRVTGGPRENGHRPAIDTLFRSAAAQRGGRVIGVVLSGTRDDGAAGLALIKANGGAVIVQDPKEAMYAGMPRSALAAVDADAVVPSTRVGETVVAMVNEEGLPPDSGPPTEPSPAEPPQQDPGPGAAPPLTTVCPECGGVLSERREAGIVQWKCRVGHRYSPGSLLDEQAHDVEEAMWAAVRALEDRRLLLERMAVQFESGQQHISARSVRRRAQEASKQAQAVRQALASASLTSLQETDEGMEERDLDELGEPEEGLAS